MHVYHYVLMSIHIQKMFLCICMHACIYMQRVGIVEVDMVARMPIDTQWRAIRLYKESTFDMHIQGKKTSCGTTVRTLSTAAVLATALISSSAPSIPPAKRRALKGPSIQS